MGWIIIDNSIEIKKNKKNRKKIKDFIYRVQRVDIIAQKNSLFIF